MLSFTIEHTTGKDRAATWAWLDERIEQELRRRVPREEMKVVETVENQFFVVKGKNVSALIRVDDNLVSITVDIPLLFVPFKSAIEAGIREALRAL